MGDEEGPTYRVTYMDGDREGSKDILTYLPRAGTARIVYSNGDTFEGAFNEMKQKHGKGVYSYTNSVGGEDEEEEEESTKKNSVAVYTGDFRFGRKEGFGKMKYPNGGVYKGSWLNDQRSGSGTYTYPNGDAYTGRWSDDIKAGRGSYSFAGKGSTLVGTWENGTMTNGKWVQAGNTSYHGSFNGSTPTGNGVFYFKSGNVVEGKYESKTSGEDEEETKNGPSSFVASAGTLAAGVGTNAADLANFCERDPDEIKEIQAEIAARELALNPPPAVEEKGEEESKEEPAADEVAPPAAEEEVPAETEAE